MLRSSFSKATIALTLLAGLNLGAMEVPTEVVAQILADNPIVMPLPTLAKKVAKPSVLQKVGSAFSSLGAGIASGVKSAGKSIYAAPQAACNFCVNNRKALGITAAIAAVVGAAGYYAYTKGFFKNIFPKAKAPTVKK